MKKSIIPGFIISLFIGTFMIFIGVEGRTEVVPNHVYRVYLNGELLGLIQSEDELLRLIDTKQYAIRERYNVENVYPPSGLEIRKVRTFNNNVSTVEEIYALIENTDPFTISGYTITINYLEDDSIPHHEAVTRPPEIIHLLNREDFEAAMITVVGAFVGAEQFELYLNENQLEIIDVGRIIENIYWLENITIRPSLISVEEEILTTSSEISRLLFFGTIEDQEYYVVRDGDDIESISATHNLNPAEFLVANPTFPSENILLTPGQVVNVGLIDPLVSVIAELHVVEDVVTRYETEYINDPNAWQGTRRVVQEGQTGLTRVTEKVRVRNGEIQALVVTDRQELVPSQNRIVSRGTRINHGGGGGGGTGGDHGNQSWTWPTNPGSIITSRFGPRWGRMHWGIDIAGTGYGSPIRAVQDGVVILNRFESGYGHYIIVDHQNGYFSLYAHFTRPSPIPVGARVTRGQTVGAMGCSGWCTGTHLHFEIARGPSWGAATRLDPCRSIFTC